MRLSAIFIVVSAFAIWKKYQYCIFDAESLRNKRVFITGASQNIGEEIAYQYAKLGADIVITARREDELKRVAKRCMEYGAKDASYIVADMNELSTYESAVEKAVKRMGGLDILVLNHVISQYEKWEATEAQFDFLEKSVQVNYISYVRLASAALPHLNETKGQLIVVASAAGILSMADLAAYGATKSAIISFFTSLQNEAIKHNHQAPSITIGILGSIATESAQRITAKDKIKVLGYPVNDTARELVEAGSLQQQFVYIPGYVRIIPTLRGISYELFDRFLLYFLYSS